MIPIKKKPKVFEETENYIEFEIPAGKREEYELKRFDKSGDGEDSEKNFYEYYIKWKK